MAPEAPDGAERRPRLTPAMADARRAVRAQLTDIEAGGLVLVALSGGPDSLALAAATAFEAPRAGLRAGAVIVDHGLQEGSAEVAGAAADQARALGLDPVVVRRVIVRPGPSGPEAEARQARYHAFDHVARELRPAAVLLGHSLDDQAETVLLGLARGSGTLSIAGMSSVMDDLYRRPLLGVRRETLARACADQGLEPWRDPHNDDDRFRRVRVRHRILPFLERELDAGIVEALARTATIAREDAEALDHMVSEIAEDLAELADGGLSLPVAGLLANPPAIRHRLIRLVARSQFGSSISRAQTLEVARLVTDWHGQGPVALPGIRVERAGGRIVFTLAVENEHLPDERDPDEHELDRP